MGQNEALFMMSGQIVLQKMLVVNLILGLGGLVLVLEGFYFALGSGMLFGLYWFEGQCVTCVAKFEFVRSMLWLGTLQLLAGVGLIIAASLLLGKTLRTRLTKNARIWYNLRQKRLIMAASLSALILIIFFLAPIVPFNTTFSDSSPQPTFPGVNGCYQTVRSVINPSFDYSGFESASRVLFDVGNYFYVRCTVVSTT